MPDLIEDEIRHVLDGQNAQTAPDDLCDFTLEDQTNVIGTELQKLNHSLNSQVCSEYFPKCLKNVTYIVAAVLINDKDEVLMIEEAKPSCHGKWYLPAGRVEPNENLIDAARREVLEESGLLLEPTTLLTVECASGSWFRFVMTGVITGGTLKTPDKCDFESIQARWVRDVSTLQLRSDDVFNLIQKCRDFKRKLNPPWHFDILPVENHHYKLFLRLIVCIKKKATNRLHVLMSEHKALHLPVCEINPLKNLHSTLRKFMKEIFGDDIPQHKPHGLLSVEFSGTKEGDGLCLTMLVSFKPPLEEVLISDNYIWHELPQILAETLEARLPRNMTIALHVVR